MAKVNIRPPIILNAIAVEVRKPERRSKTKQPAVPGGVNINDLFRPSTMNILRAVAAPSRHSPRVGTSQDENQDYSALRVMFETKTSKIEPYYS